MEQTRMDWNVLGSLVLAALMLLSSGCSTYTPAPQPAEARVPQETVPPKPTSYWEVETETNPVSGEVTKTAHLMYGTKDRDIIIRQRGKRLECYVVTDDFLETVENMHS